MTLAGWGAASTIFAPAVRVTGSPAVPGQIREPARDISVIGEFDVIVCGAGPAGVAAAVAAGRCGARTLLLEVHGCLGGIWTAGALSWILDHGNKPGLMQEILRALVERQGRGQSKAGRATNAYDVEAMKFLLEDLCAAAGVQVQLHTRVCAAAKSSVGRITHVVTESKSGREAFAGNIFVDCTGDGDVAALAGCGFDLGTPQSGKTQPMSLMALVTGLVPDQVAAFFNADETAKNWGAAKDRLRAEMERGGHSPSYAKPTLFKIHDDLFALMANHEYEVRGTIARDVTQATLRARKELQQLIGGLRSLGGIWANVRIVATGEQIGVREGRRIHGLYTVTEDDLREGRVHADAVCRVTFPVDVHSTEPNQTKGIESSPVKAKPYDLPLRALIAKDVSGLMMAGRCISGDFIAHASYRVTGNAVAMGEAAGRAAALAVKSSRLPQEIGPSELARAAGGMP